MQQFRLNDPNREGSAFNIFQVGDIEFVNPITHLSEQILHNSMNFDREIFRFNSEKIRNAALHVNNPEIIIERILRKNADRLRQEIFQKILAEELPDKILDILMCNNKGIQNKILKGLKLNRNQLILLTFKAWELFGFTYSTYRFEHLPKGVEKKQLPQLAYKEINGDLTVIGKTSLTKGQIKQIIEQRKVLIAKFMENGDVWHCFFYTQNSIIGKETGNTRHMHYVSSAWNFTREQALSKLKEKYYPFSSVPHIQYTDSD